MSSPTPGPVGSRHHDLQAMSTASSNEAADMTTVDYSKLFGSPAEQKETLKKLDHGLQTYGFVYVENHGIPTEIIEDAFSYISSPPSGSNMPYSHSFYTADASSLSIFPPRT